MNIIIVDDEPKINNGLLKLLSSQKDMKVVGAFSDARDALKFLYESPVDVMITDIRMPHVSGLELIHQVREINIEVQIVILSGYSDFSYAQKAIELGVVRYLTKPTNPKELISTLISISEKLLQKINIDDLKPDSEASNLIVSKTISYIEMNFSRKITLKDMANELYISPNYLCRLFKRHMNKHLMEYLIEFRMEKAKKYLKNVQYKVNEVAEMVGYSDTKYFSSSFKKIYNMTPMEFRNSKNINDKDNILN